MSTNVDASSSNSGAVCSHYSFIVVIEYARCESQTVCHSISVARSDRVSSIFSITRNLGAAEPEPYCSCTVERNSGYPVHAEVQRHFE
jgi:hypothetical protein